MLDLGSRIGIEVGVSLKPLCSSARTKSFEGMPLTVQTDRIARENFNWPCHL